MKEKWKALSTLLVMFLTLSMTPLTIIPVLGATETQIEISCAKAVAYLADVQNSDGSWGSTETVGTTGLVLLKLLQRAKEMSLDPFNDDPSSSTYYEYAVNVIGGFDYLLNNAHAVSITSQTLGNPDTDGNLKGIVFYSEDWPHHHTYNTGIALTAFALSDHPDDRSAAIDTLGTRTYRQIAQDAVDWLCYAQGDLGNDVGGYGYYALDNNAGGPTDWTDNSNAGYAYMGLAFAEEPPFNCIIPHWVREALNVWITTIQDPSGGSIYNPDSWDPMVNVLKTGNLIFEMAFYGDIPETPRVQAAVNYLETHWLDPNWDPGWGYSMSVANYQAKFLIEKGLTYMGIDKLDIDGDGTPEDWFNQEPSASPPVDFASVVVAQQNSDGGWPQTIYDGDPNAILSTAWAALTLEEFAPTREFGGFVTGGGWMKPEPEIGNRKASFGFVVKYHKGSTEPDGNLEFQYRYRDINLKSIEMKWLTIRGNKAIFQGTATINGKGLYTVRVEVTDGDLSGGQPDRFHIMIWQGANTEANPDYDYNNNLSGGNIDIHRR